MAITTKSIEREVEIPCGRRRLCGISSLPAGAKGVVAFAHGSGSGRFSPRNQFVAGTLQETGMDTLLRTWTRNADPAFEFGSGWSRNYEHT